MQNPLSNIAFQTAILGGASVYRARTLMNAINPHAVYNDDVQCNAILARKGRVTKANELKLKLKPNKLNSELEFESTTNLEGGLLIKVYDVVGREILKSNAIVNNTTFVLPFNFPENAIYFISVIGNNQPSFNFKLIW